MIKKIVSCVAIVASLTACTSVDRGPEISQCGSLAESAIYAYWQDELRQVAFGLIQNVTISDLRYQDLGNSKGRVTGNFTLQFEPARPGGNDGYIVCSVDGASVSLEDWNING